jgi:hypothetical protein
MPTPSLDQSVHVILGAPLAGSLGQAWGRDFIILRDPLCPGPCNVNPVRHRQQREKYLRGYLEGLAQRNRRAYAKYLRSLSQEILSAPELVAALAAFPPAKPVLLWTASSWSDRLSLWWMLDAVKRSRLGLDRFWIAEPAQPGRVKMEDDLPVTTLGRYPPESLCDAVATLRPLTAELLRAGTALWRAFAGRSATAFDVARQQARRHFADLPRVTQGYGFLLPQVGGRRPVRLRLSEFDQTLFDALRADAWQRPLDLWGSRRSRLFDFLLYYGDRFLPRRLSEWGQHSHRPPAVLTREEPRGVNQMTATSFQLTPLGVRLRDEGLHTPGEAPPMFIGGCRLYGSDPTWVRRSRGEQWWVERLND